MHKTKKQTHHKKKFHFLKYLKVTAIYFVLFLALSSMVDYYAMMMFNFTYFLVLSLLLALPIGYYHVMYGKKDHVDEVADELL